MSKRVGFLRTISLQANAVTPLVQANPQRAALVFYPSVTATICFTPDAATITGPTFGGPVKLRPDSNTQIVLDERTVGHLTQQAWWVLSSVTEPYSYFEILEV